MTLSDSVPDLLARKQADASRHNNGATSTNAPRRPDLRVVHGPAQVPQPPTHATEDHAASAHLADVESILHTHPTTSTRPPTVAEAATAIWPDADNVRHGLAGQLGAATAGIAQTLGLLLCWGAAHAFFSTRTRAAIFALVLLASLSTCAITSHN